MTVTVNGRVYTKRGQRWTFEPLNNHGRKEIFRDSRLHHALDALATLTAENARLREDAVKKLCEDADVQWVCVSYDNDATDGLPWCVDVKRRKGMSYEYWAATYDDAISVAFDDLDNARAQGWP